MSSPDDQVGEPVVLCNGTDALLVVLPHPAVCRRCDRAVCLVINRRGETACVSCDRAAKTGRAP